MVMVCVSSELIGLTVEIFAGQLFAVPLAVNE
jgi:hypothetical protein